MSQRENKLLCYVTFIHMKSCSSYRTELFVDATQLINGEEEERKRESVVFIFKAKETIAAR